MSLVENVKDAIRLIQQTDNIDLLKKMMDLQVGIIELSEEGTRLRKENQELRNIIEIEKHLAFREGMYWSEHEGTVEGPYCTRCWDAEHKRVHLHDMGYDMFDCPNCKARHIPPGKRGSDS